MKARSLPANKRRSTPDFFSTDVAAARRFYLDLNPPKHRPLVVICGGLEHCTPQYAIRRDTFPYHSLEYVARGRGELTLKGRTYPLQPGRLFSYGPGIPHQITGDAADPLLKYFVDFSGTRAAALLRSCGLSPGCVSEVFPASVLQPLLENDSSGLATSPRKPGIVRKTAGMPDNARPRGASPARRFRNARLQNLSTLSPTH